MDNDDPVRTAQVDEALARTLLTEGNNAEGERLAREAVQMLQSTAERSLLAQALTTHGTSLARLNRAREAHLTLQSAIEMARVAGDYEGAGVAALTIIEELGDHLTLHELGITFERAADFLSTSQQLTILLRLSAVARRVVYLVTALPLTAEENYYTRGKAWTDISFFDEVHRYEALLIERALREANGKVAQAAKLLHINRQAFIFLLNNHHKDLLPVRKPAIPPRRSIFRDTSSTGTKQMKPATILYVEDNQFVMGAVRDALAMEGWRVETHEDGATALAAIESRAPYDVILLDNALPNVSGLELLQRARALAHRQHTPIIMFSASSVELEARRAGVTEFLRKPEDVLTVVDVIMRLLAASGE